jgi:hypothetical protein
MWQSSLRLPHRRSWLAASIVALVFSLSTVTIASAETIVAVEGPWTMSTSVFTDNCCGTTIYYGVGQTTSSGCCTDVEIQIRGYNNSLGWHQVSSNACYAYPGSSCTTPWTEYNSSDNDATSAYAASNHTIYYPVDSGGLGGERYDYFTSTDGAHSTSSCVYTPGC